MRISVGEAREKHESLEKVVGNTQASLHNLNSDKAPFVKLQSLAALERSLQPYELSSRPPLKKGCRLVRSSRSRLLKSTKSSIEYMRLSVGLLSVRVDKEIDEREKADRKLLLTNSEKLRELGIAQKTSHDQSEKPQKAIDELRFDLVEALGDFTDGLERVPQSESRDRLAQGLERRDGTTVAFVSRRRC